MGICKTCEAGGAPGHTPHPEHGLWEGSEEEEGGEEEGGEEEECEEEEEAVG